MFGWLGQLLRVNLTSGVVKAEPLEPNVARMYLGGRGLATFLYAKEVPASAEPLSDANDLVFATGPLTGTLAPTGGRLIIVTKCRSTGGITAASIAGGWGAELKFAGFDAIIFHGKASEPVFLWIENGLATLRAAKHLWDKTAQEATLVVRQETSARAKVCSIGSPGENGDWLGVIASGDSAGVPGAGIGAVMGFKNLKAVAVSGSQGMRVAAPEDFLAATMNTRAKIAAMPITCNGLKFEDHVLLAEGVSQDTSASNSEAALPRGCFSCCARFSSFRVGDEQLRLTGHAGMQPHPQHRATGFTSQPVGGTYAPTEHSGCNINGYLILPRIVRYDGPPNVDCPGLWQALTAIADSAVLCPYSLAALDAADIGALLSTATGFTYSMDEVLRTGERILEVSRGAASG